ncbi:MAG: Unknown protein [uncultured Aureispira sp.]|uniref:Uncharacterized protein n=1 Tax=uncultured Aureispira sp. TaxID=1331704 RepID=A0A6S6SFG6_9BACT|nr:MAG: Unknown protein [uncultured Aureispira sp.]
MLITSLLNTEQTKHTLLAINLIQLLQEAQIQKHSR